MPLQMVQSHAVESKQAHVTMVHMFRLAYPFKQYEVLSSFEREKSLFERGVIYR